MAEPVKFLDIAKAFLTSSDDTSDLSLEGMADLLEDAYVDGLRAMSWRLAGVDYVGCCDKAIRLMQAVETVGRKGGPL